MEILTRFLARLRQSQLARNTLWMFGGHGFRMGFQVAYFLVLARILGPEQLGAFVGVVALASILAPFTSLGTGHLLVRGVVQTPGSFSHSWGKALTVTVLTITPLTIVLLVVSAFALPPSIQTTLIVSVALSEMLFARIVDLGVMAFQGHQLLRRSAQLHAGLSASRLIAVSLAAPLTVSLTAERWAFFHLASTAVAATMAVVVVTRELGPARIRWRKLGSDFLDGLYFSIAQSGRQAHNQADKALLAKLGSLGAAGIYGAAFRIVDAVFAPVFALLYAAYARFFQHGVQGVGASLSFAKRLLPAAMLYAMAVGVALFLIGPAVPYILGQDYRDVVGPLRWLAVLPLLRVLQYLPADSLTGAGFQRLRSALQLGAAVLNVILNVLLIPTHAWSGAAWAALVSNGCLAAGFWGAAAYLNRCEIEERET